MTSAQIEMVVGGPKFSRIIPGLMRLNQWGLGTVDLVGWIEACLEMGLTTFDHADIYGGYTNEARFGAALKESPALRGRIQLVTKCNIMLPAAERPEIKFHHYDSSKSHILGSVDRSLNNLNSDYLDLLLIHRLDVVMDADDVAAAIHELKKSGKVLHFGVSNFRPSLFELLQSRLDFPLITNQVEFSVLHLDPLNDGTFDQAQQLRFAPMAWSPVAGGYFFNQDTEQKRRLHKTLAEIGKEIGGASVDQVMIAWILLHPANILPVMGTGKLERLNAAVEAEKLELSREQWYRVWEASTGREVP
jgi:predicted oxidoreductase